MPRNIAPRQPTPICRVFNWFFCIDCFRIRIPSQKDGFGTFAGLGTFALAQGAALTAAAKSDERENLVLSIYFFAVVYTLLWIRNSLLEVSITADPDGAAARCFRTFDPESRTFGRWTLAWTLFLGCIMFALGILGLLPNQTSRVSYIGHGRIACKPLVYNDLNQELDQGRGNRYAWVEWMQNTSQVASTLGKTRHFVWVETKSGFESNFKPFTVDLKFHQDFEPGAFVCFLVKREPGKAPQYRQIDRRTGPGNTFELDAPNKDELLALVGFVETGVGDREASDNDVYLVPNFGGPIAKQATVPISVPPKSSKDTSHEK